MNNERMEGIINERKNYNIRENKDNNLKYDELINQPKKKITRQLIRGEDVVQDNTEDLQLFTE